jgi:phosphonate transport system substrate-binding protein
LNSQFPASAARLFSLLACVVLMLAADGCGFSNVDQRVGPAHPDHLVLGFVPAQEADKISDSAKPLADFLSKELKIPVTSFTATTYIGLVEGVGSAKVDIGMLSSLAYVLAHEQYGAGVILRSIRHGSGTYHTMFIARADSGIKSLEDAKGKKIAFVDPASASGYLFPAAYLKSKGMDSEKYFRREFFAGGHDKAVMAVYNGDVDVAAVFDDAREKIDKKTYPDVFQKVVKIGTTGEIPNDTVSVRKGLDPALVKQITDAFIKFAHSKVGKDTLKKLYGIEDLEPTTNADYEVVRQTARTMEVGNMPAAPVVATPKK